LIDKRFLLLGGRVIFRQGAVGLTEGSQDFPGVTGIEEVDQGRVLTFKNTNLQVLHEAADGQPEIIAHHDNGLNPFAIALA